MSDERPSREDKPGVGDYFVDSMNQGYIPNNDPLQSLTTDLMRDRHLRMVANELRLHRYLIILGFAIVIVMLAVIALSIGQLS